MKKCFNVDVVTELERYSWEKVRWTNDKLVAASPFRYDKHPSFFVDLREDSEYYGCWHDSGAIDPEWTSGNFIKLLSFLRGETYNETLEYLELVYGEAWGDEVVLPQLRLPLSKRKTPLNEDILKPYKYRHPYLSRRGISEPVQRLMNVGYDPKRKAVVMPWRLPDGRLGNVKYRKVSSKVFWYEKNGLPVKEMVYGINVIYQKRLSYAVICEAEIDAMTFMGAGVPAVALGNAHLSREKADLIKRSPLETVCICVDNDEQGLRVRDDIKTRLRAFKRVVDVFIPFPYKDVNEAWLGGEDIKKLVENRRTKVLENKLKVRLK